MALRRSIPVLLLSIAVHAGAIAAGARIGGPGDVAPLPELRSIGPSLLARESAARRALRLAEERAALVAEARKDRARGDLHLGRFLLATSRVDAEELGIELDHERAEERYAQRLEALREALGEADVAHAAAAVFGDLKYYGKPGGLMASALADGGGSCEQISQVVAAAVFDAGRPKEIALRYYGGVMADGASHLTPVAIAGKIEHDLMTGQPALPGGIRLAADDLVEIYARAHGLAANDGAPPALSAASSNGSPSASATGSAHAPASAAPTEAPASAEDAGRERRPTLVAGMPPNGDKFPGSLPLYAAHALRDPDEVAGAGFDLSEEQQARFCPFYVRLGTLSPPQVAVEIARDGAPTFLLAEPRKVPGPAILEREATLLRAAENVARKSSTAATDRLVSWACLAALGEVAAIDFELAGEHGAATESVRVHRLGRERGKAALAEIDWSSEDGKDAARTLLREYGGQSWVLLAIEGGERLVMQLAGLSRKDMDGWIGLHSALIVWPGTREKILPIVSARPLSEQMEVMQAIFLTSDRTRYLPGSVDLDGTSAPDAPSARFLAAYRVFRRLAARLWDGEPPADTLSSFASDVRADGVDADGEAALLDYYARNTLALYAQRIEVAAGAPPHASPHGARASRVEKPMSVTFAPSDPHAALTGGGPAHPAAWQRPGGMDVVRALRDAVERNRHPSLDRVRRCLLYIEAQGRLDPRTLADGLRVD